MSTRILKTRIQNKIDSEARWKNHPEFIPLAGEAIIYTDVNGDSDKVQIKFGDGITTIDKLPFATSPEASNVIIENVPSQSGTLTYNGSEQSPVWSNFDETQMYISGITTGTNAGEYTAYFTPLAGYCWSDGTTAAKEVAWKMSKATPTITVPTNVSVAASANSTFTVQTNSTGTITATSNKTSVATVSVSGKTVTIKYVSTGTATVTVTVGGTTNYNLVTSNINVTAKAKENLNSYTWEQLANMAMNYEFMNKFDVGDQKSITLQNLNNPPIYTSMDGITFDGSCEVTVLHMSSTAAGEYVYFGCFGLPAYGYTPVCLHTSMMYPTTGSTENYKLSAGRALLGATDKNNPASGTIMAQFPPNMRRYFSGLGINYGNSVGEYITDYLALLSELELTGEETNSKVKNDSVILMEGSQFDIFKNGNNFAGVNYLGDYEPYWLRSVPQDTTGFLMADSGAATPIQTFPAGAGSLGMYFFFCINYDSIDS